MSAAPLVSARVVSRAMVKVPTTSRFAVFHAGQFKFIVASGVRTQSAVTTCVFTDLYYPLPDQWSGGDWGEN